MTEFWQAVEYLVYGFVAGFFWNPAVTLCRRVYEEFKLAREQWSKPRG